MFYQIQKIRNFSSSLDSFSPSFDEVSGTIDTNTLIIYTLIEQ